MDAACASSFKRLSCAAFDLSLSCAVGSRAGPQLPHTADTTRSERLNSGARAARINFTRFAFHPLIVEPLARVRLNESRKPRLLISLTSRLRPWSYR